MTESVEFQVEATRFGEISAGKDDVIFFPQGIIGFPDLKNFVLIDHERDSPFKWLQSLDDGSVAFVIVNPLLFKPDYLVEVTETDVSGLDIKNEDDAVISVIVTVPEDPEQMSANLKAPLVFNPDNRHGKQIILAKSDYKTRHKVLEEIRGCAGTKDTQKLQSAVEKMTNKEL